MHVHRENKSDVSNSYEALESSPCGSDLKDSNEGTDKRESASGTSLFKNWPLMSSIIVYCAFSLHDMAYTEVIFSRVFSLFYMEIFTLIYVNLDVHEIVQFEKSP